MTYWNIFLFFFPQKTGILFFPEDRIKQFMQIVSNEDNLHEISNPVFWEKQEKSHQFVIC